MRLDRTEERSGEQEGGGGVLLSSGVGVCFLDNWRVNCRFLAYWNGLRVECETLGKRERWDIKLKSIEVFISMAV